MADGRAGTSPARRRHVAGDLHVSLLDPTTIVSAPERAVRSMPTCVPGPAASELRNHRAKFPYVHSLVQRGLGAHMW